MLFSNVVMAIALNVQWVDELDHAQSPQPTKYIGGTSGEIQWMHTEGQAIENIEQDLFAYYAKKDGRVLKLTVGLSPDGSKCLMIRADGGHSQTIANLFGRQCSSEARKVQFK
jgi:hypothetical protein